MQIFVAPRDSWKKGFSRNGRPQVKNDNNTRKLSLDIEQFMIQCQHAVMERSIVAYLKENPRLRFPWEEYLKDTFTKPSLSISSLRYYWLRTGSFVAYCCCMSLTRVLSYLGVTVIIYQIGSFPDLGLVLLWNITAECPDQCPCTPRAGSLSFAFYRGSDPALTSKKKKKKKKDQENVVNPKAISQYYHIPKNTRTLAPAKMPTMLSILKSL